MKNVADLINPETGNTYREDNAATNHTIPLGTLVETQEGLRLYVVHHGWDHEQKPMYYISHRSPESYAQLVKEMEEATGNPYRPFLKGMEAGCRLGAYLQRALTVIQYPEGMEGVSYRVLWLNADDEAIDWIYEGAPFPNNRIFKTALKSLAEERMKELQDLHPKVKYRIVQMLNDESTINLTWEHDEQ